MAAMLRDLIFAVRTLRRAPGFAVSAILALALGIGANTAVFSVVYAVLLAPLPLRFAGTAGAPVRVESQRGRRARGSIDGHVHGLARPVPHARDHLRLCHAVRRRDPLDTWRQGAGREGIDSVAGALRHAPCLSGARPDVPQRAGSRAGGGARPVRGRLRA